MKKNSLLNEIERYASDNEKKVYISYMSYLEDLSKDDWNKVKKYIDDNFNLIEKISDNNSSIEKLRLENRDINMQIVSNIHKLLN